MPGRKRAAGLPYLSDGELSARLTEAKLTPERAWLGEVSSVVLQQAVTDLNAAYRNFFASVTGHRKGPVVAPPRFRSRKDRRQSIRFTRNARFAITSGGKLRLPKIGDVKVRWSRDLPSEPSSVTVIADATGRYFASFVVQARDDLLPDAGTEVGIDLGLTHFAVLSDSRKVASPRFLRRAERRLRKAQRALSRKAKGSSNRDKARVRVARVHARVTDSRQDWLHKESTRIIRENQAVYVEDPARQIGARRRLVGVHRDAGVQGPQARAHLRQDRPVRADLPSVLSLRRQGRPEAAAHSRVDLRRLRDAPRPGRERCPEHSHGGTRRDSKCLWRRRKPRACPGGCQ